MLYIAIFQIGFICLNASQRITQMLNHLFGMSVKFIDGQIQMC